MPKRSSVESRILTGRCNTRRMGMESAEDEVKTKGGELENLDPNITIVKMDGRASIGEMDPPTWTSNRCLTLIAAYKLRPCLWDPNDGYYFDRDRKAEAWGEISQEMDIPVTEIKRKMESLTSSFRREKGKHKRINESGRVYKSDWYAFKAFSFLMSREGKSKANNKSNDNDNENHHLTDQDSDNTSDIEKLTDFLTGENSERTSIPRKRKSGTHQTQLPKKLKDSTHELISEETVVPNGCAIWQTSVDDDDPTLMFTRYLGKKLNKYDPRTRATIIHDINQLIFQADMNAHPE
ncbi:unnamed protein product [Bemisia tabaci]|uniref:MADF domain-containing protein n=1 Tax=Bemisia tabaci TaxID=7038 RepID=A0A9P0AIQ0_BEMTA|nr:unnamed protein product [Bemisia tabaci]